MANTCNLGVTRLRQVCLARCPGRERELQIIKATSIALQNNRRTASDGNGAGSGVAGGQRQSGGGGTWEDRRGDRPGLHNVYSSRTLSIYRPHRGANTGSQVSQTPAV